MSKYSLYICFALEIRIDLGQRPFCDVRTLIKKTVSLQHQIHLYQAFQDILKQTLKLI